MMSPFRFFAVTLCRLIFFISGCYCVYASFVNEPFNGLVWVGSAMGFLTAGLSDRTGE